MDNYLLSGHNFKYITKNSGGYLVFKCENCLEYFVKYSDKSGIFYSTAINGIFELQLYMPSCAEYIIKSIIK